MQMQPAMDYGENNCDAGAGLAFDMAIRLYLESFRLPGEAQKINRVMESFGKHYHAQCPAPVQQRGRRLHPRLLRHPPQHRPAQRRGALQR